MPQARGIRLMQKGERLGPLLGGRKQVLGQFPLSFSLTVELRRSSAGAARHCYRPKVPGQHIHHCLVGRHYNRGVRDLADQLSTEATIYTSHTFLCANGA